MGAYVGAPTMMERASLFLCVATQRTKPGGQVKV
jgi:hypothetical protein